VIAARIMSPVVVGCRRLRQWWEGASRFGVVSPGPQSTRVGRGSLLFNQSPTCWRCPAS